jgi:hypothetical protein
MLLVLAASLLPNVVRSNPGESRDNMLAGSTEETSPSTWHLIAHLYSLHESTSDPDITNRTPGVGFMRRTETHWLAGGGVFRNSIGRTSGYAVMGKQWEFGPVRVGGIGGLTHNYKGNNGGVVPMAAGLVTVPLGDRLAFEFIAIPRVRDYTYATLNMSLSWRLK